MKRLKKKPLKYIQQLQSRDTRAIPVKSAANNNRRTMVIKHDLQVPTIKQEARKYSVNYRKRLDVHPNSLANALFQDQLGNRRLKRLYPGDLATNGYSATFPRDSINPCD